MPWLEVLDRLNELLDATDDATVNTSMRLPSALRAAAAPILANEAVQALSRPATPSTEP